jgi:hypothetical protein
MPKADDYQSQPAGNAGDRVACAVIKAESPTAPKVGLRGPHGELMQGVTRSRRDSLEADLAAHSL